uniref:SH3 domain-containing protein n=1 Tax=Panagrolaimus sp. PS1159 TaxID=55785 RepID=A0AC35ETH4_9BILA
MSDDSGSPREQPKVCVATSEYIARQNDEMSLEVNDVIEISLLLDDGWMKGKKLFGHQESGCFPSNHVRIIQPSSNAMQTYCKTKFDYEAQSTDELSFGEGEFILILKTDVEEGWMYGRLLSNENVGVFPTNYVRFLTSYEANIEFLFKDEEADKENMKAVGSLMDPEIVFKNDKRHAEEVSDESKKEENGDTEVINDSRNNDSVINDSRNNYSANFEDIDTSNEMFSNKNGKYDHEQESFFATTSEAEAKGDGRDMNDESLFATTSEAEAKGDGRDMNDDDGFGNKTAAYTNPLLFQVVNDPTVLDYEYHIEEDENGTRPGCKTYTATVKWTVKTGR